MSWLALGAVLLSLVLLLPALRDTANEGRVEHFSFGCAKVP